MLEKFKKYFIVIPMALAISAWGWGQGSKIENAIRQNLKDPASVQFKGLVISAKGNRACIVWNAKNSMGGYGDWSVAELTKDDSDWMVKTMEGEPKNCTQKHWDWGY